MASSTPHQLPLRYVRVLDLSTGYAASLCSLHLADQGAHVFGLHDESLARPYKEDPFLSHKVLLRRGQIEQLPELLHTLLPHVDVVLEDQSRSALDDTSMALLEHHHVIHAHLPDFHPHTSHGISSAPRKALPPGALEAFMGLYEAPLGRHPSAHHLSLLDVTAAAWMASAIVAALIGRARQKRPFSLLLPRADVAYPILELTAMFTLQPPRVWPTLQWASTPFIAAYPCKTERSAPLPGDFLYLHVGLSHHLARFCEVIAHHHPTQSAPLLQSISPDTLAEPTCVSSLREQRRISRELHALFALRTASDWEALLSEAGLCAVRTRPLEEWCEKLPQAVASGQILRGKQKNLSEQTFDAGNDVPGATLPLEQPGVVVSLDASRRTTPRPPASYARDTDEFIASLRDLSEQVSSGSQAAATLQKRGDTTRVAMKQRPLHGVRVLDLTHVIAGPTSTRLLAELGATVLRIENPHFQAPWVEAFHIAYNAGKSSVTIDLKSDEGASELEALLEEFSPDIVALNLRPDAGSGAGVDEATMRERCPQIIYAHLTAYGSSGPWGHRPGWEQTAQAVTGVQLSWGADEGRPDLFPLPLNDLCTGIHGGFGMLCALFSKVNAGPAIERVETDLVTTSIWMQALARYGRAGARIEGKSATGHGPLERLYKVKDGWGYLVALKREALWFIEGFEHLRGSREEALAMGLANEFEGHSFDTWRRRIQRAGLGPQEIVWVRRRTQKQVLQDRWARAIGLVHRRKQAIPGEHEVTETSSPLWIDGERHTLDRAPWREASLHGEASNDALVPWLRDQLKGAVALGLSRRTSKPS